MLTDTVDYRAGHGNHGMTEGPACVECRKLMNEKVSEATTKMQKMNEFFMIVIDTHEIAQYHPKHPLWPTWHAMSQRLTNEVGFNNEGLNIAAKDQTAIATAFEQVASAMEAGGAAG